jgi:GNAT superfamily N-acetyltransferase
VSAVRFPEGFSLHRLRRDHPRRKFDCGQDKVNDWLAAKALQNQEKRLSVTKVLVDKIGSIVGYYTLATGQVDFGDLPTEVSKALPRRVLPVAVLAWLGVDKAYQGRGFGQLILAQALRDCHEAGKTFAFVAVILDCIDDAAKSFYQHYDFQSIPGHPYRLFLGIKRLDEMMKNT